MAGAAAASSPIVVHITAARIRASLVVYGILVTVLGTAHLAGPLGKGIPLDLATANHVAASQSSLERGFPPLYAAGAAVPLAGSNTVSEPDSYVLPRGDTIGAVTFLPQVGRLTGEKR